MTPANAFRIGADGLSAPLPAPSTTLPQPFYPSVNGAAAGDVDTLDPNYKPERTDNFNVAIQREVNAKTTLEVGYIGRIIRNEYTEINLDAVPTMMTLGGQSFRPGVLPGLLAALQSGLRLHQLPSRRSRSSKTRWAEPVRRTARAIRAAPRRWYRKTP